MDIKGISVRDTDDGCWLLFIFSSYLLQLEACAHPFFDELRDPNVRLPNNRPLPPLFNFKQEVR